MSQHDEELGVDIRAVYEDIIYNTIIKQFKCEIKECLLWYVIQKIDFQKESQKTKKSSKKKEESVA